MRREVRQAIRHSLREVAAQAPAGAFSPQVVTGLILTGGSEPTPAWAEALNAVGPEVVQGYARALTESLGRRGRAPFVLAGLALWDDLQAIRDSLARCLVWQEEPHLRHWHESPRLSFRCMIPHAPGRPLW